MRIQTQGEVFVLQKSQKVENVHYSERETSWLAQSAELAVSSRDLVIVLDFMWCKVLKESFTQSLVSKRDS